MSINRSQAWDLLTRYNKEPFHLRHAITVEHVMGWYARELGYGDQAEFWSIGACSTTWTSSSGPRSTARNPRS